MSALTAPGPSGGLTLPPGEHLVVEGSLRVDKRVIPTRALIDCGATGTAFVDEAFVRLHALPVSDLYPHQELEVIDGRPISSGPITQTAMAELTIENHREPLRMFVTNLGHYPLVLGLPWLRAHDVNIRFAANTITFESSTCHSNCLRPAPVEPVPRETTTPATKTPSDESPIRAAIGDPHKRSRLSLQPVAQLAAVPFCRLVQTEKLEVASISLRDINRALTPEASGTTQAGEPQLTALKAKIPSQYHAHLNLFSEVLSEKLPPHRVYDHRIPLSEGFSPPFGKLYAMSQPELVALTTFLEENLSKGFIRASSSPAGAPVLFVKKSDGSLRLCVDYRGLNAGTIKNRYPLPLVQETLMHLQKAKYYTTLDVRGAYNLIRMADGEEWKTAFRTRYGLYESLVMNFGLTNSPASFQHFINDVLHEFLDVFATAYLDDILIYSDTLAEHEQHVTRVLEALSKSGLHLKPEKCHFHCQEVKYLGLIITPGGIRMDPTKVSAIQEWEKPRNIKDVRVFLGFSNFYRRFIRAYSRVVSPLVNLTRKGVPFEWDGACQDAFDTLKAAFTSAPLLRHFDHERDSVVETDASDYVSAGVLSQPDDQGVMHPVAYFSKKHSPAECNYEIYDKEMLAIVRAFEEWRPHLESAPCPVTVLSDHKNLEYFMSSKLLNRRQARWSEFLSRFNFQIVYRPGKSGGKPDALTRRSSDSPGASDPRAIQQHQVVLKPHNLEAPLQVSGTSAGPMSGITREGPWEEAYQADPFPSSVVDLLRKGARHSKDISLAECSVRDGRLYYNDRLYVPRHEPLILHLLQSHHDPPSCGHPGQAKTFELLSRTYYWPNMRKDTSRYVRNCQVCSRSKTTTHGRHGELKPLRVPARPWADISMDFVVGLPPSEGYDSIWVVVDRLTKQRHLVPCHSTIGAEGLADLFIQHVWRLHGLPTSIVSDRGPQFASRFWGHLCARLGIARLLSTSFHPETDGQTERTNHTMEQYLRAYINYQQDNWVQYLALAEFAANNQESATTHCSPFFANYGYHPRISLEATPVGGAPDAATQLAAIHDFVRSEMRFSQDEYKEMADRHRLPAPRFLPGDLVWLDARHIRTIRPSSKLDFKRLGPFAVIEPVGTHAYRLDLPPTMKVHPVFHVSLLSAVSTDAIPGQQTLPAPPVYVDGEEEWHVDAILDSRIRRNKLQYLVQWTGWTNPTWEPAEFLDATSAVDEFHARYPAKAGPLSRLSRAPDPALEGPRALAGG